VYFTSKLKILFKLGEVIKSLVLLCLLANVYDEGLALKRLFQNYRYQNHLYNMYSDSAKIWFGSEVDFQEKEPDLIIIGCILTNLQFLFTGFTVFYNLGSLDKKADLENSARMVD
jgi:hypothetical protein